MISSTWFTIMTCFILFMGIVDSRRRMQWYIFGIFFCLVIITSVLLNYFNLWINMLPFFMEPELFHPGGVA